MKWQGKFTQAAEKDLFQLDGSQRILVQKAIRKVSQNPLPDYQGGYGKPLSNKANSKLAGYLKIKLKAAGIRIVYKLVEINGVMVIVVIGARADNEVYDIAQKRIARGE